MFVQVKHCLYTLENFVLSFYFIKMTIHGILYFINIKVCKMSQLFHAKQISKFLLGYIITQLRTYKRYFYRMSRCLLRKQLFFPTVLYRLMETAVLRYVPVHMQGVIMSMVARWKQVWSRIFIYFYTCQEVFDSSNSSYHSLYGCTSIPCMIWLLLLYF